MYRRVEISSIELDNKRYRFGPVAPDQRLVRSLGKQGILNPVKLLEENGKFTVLSGWKRILVCSRNNIARTVPAAVYDPSVTSEIQRILILLDDNYERLNDLDKAEIIRMLNSYTGLSEEDIIKLYLPLSGIAPSRKNYDKYLSVSLLSEDIKESFHEGRYSFEHLELFSGIQDDNDRDIIFREIFCCFRFNLNESREVIKNLLEIASRDKNDTGSILEEIFTSSGTDLSKNEFIKMLRNRRNPTICRMNKEFNEIAGSINTDENTSLIHHPYFERNDLEFRISFRTLDDLKQSVTKLTDEIDKGSVGNLLDFIRTGGGLSK